MIFIRSTYAIKSMPTGSNIVMLTCDHWRQELSSFKLSESYMVISRAMHIHLRLWIFFSGPKTARSMVTAYYFLVWGGRHIIVALPAPARSMTSRLLSLWEECQCSISINLSQSWWNVSSTSETSQSKSSHLAASADSTCRNLLPCTSLSSILWLFNISFGGI